MIVSHKIYRFFSIKISGVGFWWFMFSNKIIVLHIFFHFFRFILLDFIIFRFFKAFALRFFFYLIIFRFWIIFSAFFVEFNLFKKLTNVNRICRHKFLIKHERYTGIWKASIIIWENAKIWNIDDREMICDSRWVGIYLRLF